MCAWNWGLGLRLEHRDCTESVWSFLFGPTALLSGKGINCPSHNTHTHNNYLGCLRIFSSAFCAFGMERNWDIGVLALKCSIPLNNPQQYRVFYIECPIVLSVCVWVCVHRSSCRVLCQHQARYGWKHSLIFCPLTPIWFLIFSIWYDNLLQGYCSAWEKTLRTEFTNTICAEWASFCEDTCTVYVLGAYNLLSVLMTCLIPSHPLTFLGTVDRWEIKEECVLWRLKLWPWHGT